VLVLALALLSLAGFWLGILAAGHASAGPAGAEVRQTSQATR
jgi:hypothetical protein